MKSSTIFFIGLMLCCILSCNDQWQVANTKNSTTGDSARSNQPLFHFGPPKNWINDPNGLVFHNGVYHLFYQYNPFSDKWGHMSWGHATSTDLMHWKQEPVAIPEFRKKDTLVTSIFSGTAFIDSFNTSGLGTSSNPSPLIAIYTANVTASQQVAQYQNMAYSNDNAKSFTQWESNPILDIHSREFRDPKVFWYAPAKKWVMIVAKPDDHKVLFFGSSTLKKWTKLGDFGGNIGNTDKVWECPDIFELPVENSVGENKWVITVSAGHAQNGFEAMQYFVGNFDGRQFTADPLQYPLYLDQGKDFYAGITYNDIPASDGRRILVGWINCWEYANLIPSGGYRGRLSVPRKLTLFKNTAGGYQLMQQPVREFDALRQEVFSLVNTEVDSVFNFSFHGRSYEMDVTFDPGNARMEGVKILKSKDEETVLKYNFGSETFSLDRTKSGDVSFSPKFSSVETAKVSPEKGLIKMKILVDKTIVSVFINDGKTVLTDQVFPKEQEGAIQLFSEGGKTNFKSVKIYTVQM